MKNFTLLSVLFLMSSVLFGQQANFNWKNDTISSGNNLQGMTVTGDSSAVIIGYDNTFKKISATETTDIKAFEAEYNFIGLSANDGVSIFTSRRSKIINHPSGGVPDVYVSSIMMKSEDMGESWSVMDVTKIGSGDDPSINPNADGSYAKEIYAVGVYNNDTILAYSSWYDISSGDKETHGAVFRTNDGGESWEPITTDLGSGIITKIMVQDSMAYFGGLKSLFKVNLKSDSISNIYPNLALGTDSNLYVSSVTLKSTNEFYVTTTTDGIFKTTDGGQLFTRIEAFGGANDLCIVNDSTLVALGNSSKSMVSTDNGATWTDCYPGATCYSIGGIFGDTLYGMADTYAYKIAVSDLINKSFNWTNVELNDTEDNLQKMAIFNNNNAIIIGYTEMCKTTSDGGLTWQTATLPSDFNEDVEFDFTSISNNEAIAFSTVRRYKIADFPSDAAVNDFYMEGLIISTTDNWENISILDVSKIGADDGADATLNPQVDGCYGLNPYTIECVDANTAYVYANWNETATEGTAKSRGRVFKTSDAGDSWTGITKDFGSAYINGIEFIGDLGYIGGSSVLLKTTDGGTTFTDLYPAMYAINPDDSTIYIKSITLINENEFYLSTTSNGVFYTIDGGDSFTKFENVSGTSDVYKLDQNSFMLLGTTSKSYFTNDGGETWQNPNVGKSVYSIGGVFNDSLYALGAGIVYKISLSDLDLTTAAPIITKTNDIKVQYHTNHINIVSSNELIEKCLVYSVTGQLMTIKNPESNICKLNNSEYKPGIYVIALSVKGEKFTTKVVFK